MSYCRIHGSYTDYFNDGCTECKLAELELKAEISQAAYRSSNPGDHDCPHCRYKSLNTGATRCPLCHGQVGSDYWTAEFDREDARKAAAKAAAEVANRETAAAKRAAVVAERVAFDRATLGIQRRLLALAFIVAALWWVLRRYDVWLPESHPQYINVTLEVFSRYVGAILGAALVFIAVAYLTPRWPRAGVAAVALFILYAIELTQIYRAPWVETIRGTWLGGLVWSNGFRWSHLLCYTIGVVPLATEQEEVEAFGVLVAILLFLGGPIAIWQFIQN